MLTQSDFVGVNHRRMAFLDFSFVTKFMLEVKVKHYATSKNIQQSQKSSFKAQSNRFKIKT
jgi:hypothetical protein